MGVCVDTLLLSKTRRILVEEEKETEGEGRNERN